MVVVGGKWDVRGCEGYVIFAQDGIRWAAWSDEMFGGFGREVLEGDRKGDDINDPDGPKWTAWSVSLELLEGFPRTSYLA